MKKIINAICAFISMLVLTLSCHAADSATAVMSLVMPDFTKIEPITSPVLTANVTDRTGNMYAPMHARFKITSNTPITKSLYLKANVVTEAGYEESMFAQDGQVYIAFANIEKIPSSTSLFNCKTGALPKDSPNVVAYPVISISGAEHEYLYDKNKYELFIKNGITNINVHVGSRVLKNSFASNDSRGFYQAVLSLTEADI